MLRDIGLPTTHLWLSRHVFWHGGVDYWLGLAGLLGLLLVGEHPLEVHELRALEALADGPLQDVAVCGDGDEVLGLALPQVVLLCDPVYLPHWSRVLMQGISGRRASKLMMQKISRK